jgi:hypothetical protein
MQANPFFGKLVLLAAVAMCGGLCLTAGVLALVSPAWRSRLGRIALHALWIVPVAGLFCAALSWRMHHARSQAVPPITWTSPTPLTVPATPWPPAEPSLQFPRTETFQVPTTTLRYSFSPTWGLIALAGIAVALAGVFAWRFMRRHTATMIPVAGVVAALALVGAGLLAVVAIRERQVAHAQLAAEVRMLATRDAVHQKQLAAMQSRQWARSGEPRPSQVLDYRGNPVVEQPVQSADVELPVENPPATEIVAYVGSIPTGQRLTELPAWVTATSNGDDSLPRTYTSGLWVTTDEADQELLRHVAPELQHYFWSEYPAAAGWSPAPEMIVPSGAVARRCYETVPVQFGEHTQTMHKAHWQVARTPEVARYFFDKWRPLAVQQRLVRAGAVIGLLTLVFGALGAYYRLNAATAGRFRGRLRFATGAVCIAGGLAAILLA